MMRGSKLLLTGILTMGVAISAFSWKLVREDGDKPSKVKMIQIVDDRLIVITDTGVIDLKVPQLSSTPTPSSPSAPVPASKSASSAPPVPASPPTTATSAPSASTVLPVDATLIDRVAKALKTSDRWYVLSVKSRGFKAMGKKTVKNFQEGDLFRGATVNDRLFLQDGAGVIYESTWEISFDFTKFVVPVETYLKKQTANLMQLRATLADREQELAENKRMTVFYITQIVELLKGSYTTEAFYTPRGDVNLNIVNVDDVTPNNTLFYTELRLKLNRLQTAKRKLDKDILNLRKDIQTVVDRLEKLTSTLAARRKT